jgi:hypothetical protein
MLPILLTFWPFMEKVIKNNKKYLGNCLKENQEKIQRNALSSLNAIGSIILTLLYLITKNDMTLMTAILFPLIFYIYDTYYLWFHKEQTGFKYIVHHLTAIYSLQCIYLSKYDTQIIIFLAFLCTELSNIPLYYVYHFLKTNDIKDIEYYKKLLNIKKIQLILYTSLRIFCCGYLFLKVFEKCKHKPVLTLSFILIYFMGAYWLNHQIKGYFKTQKEYEELLKNENKM